jgi:hypothetical protein
MKLKLSTLLVFSFLGRMRHEEDSLAYLNVCKFLNWQYGCAFVPCRRSLMLAGLVRLVRICILHPL